MNSRRSEIPTEEELSLERRKKQWDGDKLIEFCDENLEKVIQYLIDGGLDVRIADHLEKYPVHFQGESNTLPDDEKRDISIKIYRKNFAYDLCYLMFLLKSGPVQRQRISQGGLEYQKTLFSAYLTRLEIILKDPSFVKYMEFDLDTLLAKYQRLRRQVEERKHKRAGQSKILATAMDSLVSKLDDYGYESEYQCTEFLYQFLYAFEIPGFRATNKEEAIDKIRKWIPLTYPA